MNRCSMKWTNLALLYGIIDKTFYQSHKKWPVKDETLDMQSQSIVCIEHSGKSNRAVYVQRK